jgi:hypothetical protein
VRVELIGFAADAGRERRDRTTAPGGVQVDTFAGRAAGRGEAEHTSRHGREQQAPGQRGSGGGTRGFWGHEFPSFVMRVSARRSQRATEPAVEPCKDPFVTFSLLMVDSSRRWIGAVTASRSLAVGNATVTVHPAVGAVASQAWTNRSLHAWGHGHLADGTDPEKALTDLPRVDPEPEWRQVALLGVDGRVAAHTGERTTPWTGHLLTDSVVALGNCLTGPEVLDAMLEGLDPEPVDLAAFALGLAGALERGDARRLDRARCRRPGGAAVLAAGARDRPARGR